jgi:hypothetical protein
MRISAASHHPLYSSLHRPPAARPVLALSTFLALFMTIPFDLDFGRYDEAVVVVEVRRLVTRSMHFRRRLFTIDEPLEGPIKAAINEHFSSWVLPTFFGSFLPLLFSRSFAFFSRCHILVDHLI